MGVLQAFELDFTDFNVLLFPSHLFSVSATEQWMQGMFAAAMQYGLPSQVRACQTVSPAGLNKKRERRRFNVPPSSEFEMTPNQ